jgi:hypothetical protein
MRKVIIAATVVVALVVGIDRFVLPYTSDDALLRRVTSERHPAPAAWRAATQPATQPAHP